MKILEEQVLAEKTVKYCKRRGGKFDPHRIFYLQSGERGTKYLRKWFTDARVETNTSTEKNFYTFHTARHTFVSSIVRYSANVALAQKLVGHKDIKTTQIYVHPQLDQLDLAIDSLPTRSPEDN